MDVTAMTNTAVERLRGSSFPALSATDRLLVTIWGLEADVNNGGFDQYYFNSTGDQAALAPIALRQIGAVSMAALVEKANAAFGPSGPPTDRDLRQEQLETIREEAEETWRDLDEQFWKYPDDIVVLLYAHLKRAV